MYTYTSLLSSKRRQPFTALRLRRGMQIVVKTLTGKAIILEVEIPRIIKEFRNAAGSTYLPASKWKMGAVFKTITFKRRPLCILSSVYMEVVCEHINGHDHYT